MSRIEEVIKAILGEGEITSDLISRLEKIFEAIYEDKMYKGYTLSRSEMIVCCMLEGTRYDGPVIGRIEQILKAIANDGHYDGPVISRVEELLIKWFTEYHKVVEFTGEFPATIRSTGNDIVDYRIYGNTVQDGEPSPDNPVDVVGCGVPVNIELGEPLCGIGEYKDTLDLATGVVTRRVKKLVLTGEEDWRLYIPTSFPNYFRYRFETNTRYVIDNVGINSHHIFVARNLANTKLIGCTVIGSTSSPSGSTVAIRPPEYEMWSVDDFKSYLADQYSNGTPVTVWYVLQTPETETIQVPKGLTGTIEGYLIQDGEPTPDNPIYPVANGGDLTPQKTNLLTDRTIKPNGYFDTSGTWVPDKSYQTYTSAPVTEDLYSLSFTGIQNGSEIYLNLFDAQMNLLANITPYEGPAGNLNFTIHQTGNLAISYNPNAVSDLVLVHGEEPGPTKSPTYSIPLGYKLPIVTSGVNLFDKDDMIEGQYYGDNGVVGFDDRFSVTDFIPVNANEIYVHKFFGDFSGSQLFTRVMHWDKNKNFVSQIFKQSAYDTTPHIIKTVVDGYITLSVPTNFSPYTTIIKGSTPPTQYEPYHPPITTDIYLGAEPLHKIGDYADYVDFERGVVVRNVKKLVLDNPRSLRRWRTRYEAAFERWILEFTQCNGGGSVMYSAVEGITVGRWNEQYMSIKIADNLTGLNADSPSSEATEKIYEILDDLSVKGMPVIAWYTLAKPEEETPPVPFPKIPTFDGTTILDVPEDLYPRPSKVELEYYGDLYMTADNRLYRMPNGEFLGG